MDNCEDQDNSESLENREGHLSQEELLVHDDGEGTVLISDQHEPPDEEVPPDLLPQVLGSGVAALSILSISTMIAYSGVMLPQLMDPNTHDLQLNTSQVALFTSLIFIGALMGSTLAIIPMVRLGQRVTLIMGLLLALTSWLTLALAPTVWLLLLARLLQGLATSIVRVSVPTYVAELAHSTVRGVLTSTIGCFFQSGFLLMYAIATSDLTWRQVALMCGTVTTIPTIIGLCYLPDSPRWLATRGRTDEVYKSLRFFRGPNYDSRGELTRITEQLERTVASQMNVLDQLREMRKPSTLLHVIVMVVANFFVPFDGYPVIPGYLVIIINDANIRISSYLCAVIVGVMGVLGGFIFMFAMDRINRRKLLTMSTLTAAICTALLGMYFYDKQHKRFFQGQEWFPIVLLAIYTTSSLNPVLSIFRSEIFPNAVRSTVVPVILTFLFAGGFLATESFPYIVKEFGDSGAFWFFSGCNMVGSIIVLFTVPETRGKSLEQITEIQSNSSVLQNNDNI